MTRKLIVEADGGSRGNPGPAAYGAVVKDAASNTVIIECAEFVGIATNNVAEYSGLIAGLRAAKACDPAAEILIRMDSKLVVEQMSGRWKVKNEGLKPLVAEAKAAAKGLNVSYMWIPREKNQAADALANEAMDAEAAGTNWSTHLSPRPFLEALDAAAHEPTDKVKPVTREPSDSTPQPPTSAFPITIPDTDDTHTVISCIAHGYDVAHRARIKSHFKELQVNSILANEYADPAARFAELSRLVTAHRGHHVTLVMPAVAIAQVVLRALGAGDNLHLAERLDIKPGSVTSLVISEGGMPIVHHIGAEFA